MPAITKNHAGGTAGEIALDIEAIEVLMGMRPGSRRDRDEIEKLRQLRGEQLYRDIIATLIHKDIASADEAREVFNGIVRHKQQLDVLLGRDIGVQVAALDYARTIHILLDNPTIIEKEKIAILSRLARQDTEARVYDKGALLADLKKEIERTRRYGQVFAVVFIDVDNLKDLNETHGSAAGDRVLGHVAAVVKSAVRSVDSLYRFGGDEFVLLLPSADITVARRVAEKLLQKIRETPVPDESFLVTASIGLEAFDDQSAQDAAGVLFAVDTLLSAAKRAGKNRIEMPQHEEQKKRLRLPEMATAPPRKNERFLVRGTAISQGVAVGRAYLYEDILNDIEYYEIEEAQIEMELERMRGAVVRVRKDVERMEKQVRLNLGKEYADIFAVHRAILSDMTLINELEEKLKHEKRNAEHVVRSVFKHFESRFISSENQLMRERSLDIADLSRRLLRHLAGRDHNIFAGLPRNSVVIAKRLLPSESVHLRRGNVAGIVTEKGSRNSHAAILARGLGIPYVSEPDLPIELIPQGNTLIVNADRGEIIVNPTAEDRETIRSAIELRKKETGALIARFKDAALQAGGRRILVMANVGTRHTIDEAVEYGCDGIGLYRIEQTYMQSRVFPTQEQLYRTLDEMFEGVPGKDIVVRLLDIGGDKTLPYFSMKDDIYSVLGVRGVRLLLRYPRILDTQLSVLLKLSRKYRISILIPMVTLPEEITSVRAHLDKEMRHLERHDIAFDPGIKLGAMVEIPAAVLGIREILARSDFVSIGTNDLIQYTMASARENTALSGYYESGTKTVLGLVESTLRAAREAGVPCSLCGELAADTSYTRQLLAMGLEIFSVAPGSILSLKSKISSITSKTIP